MASVEQPAAHDEHAAMSKKDIWKVFFVLLGITVVEFIVALAIPDSVLPHALRIFIYIVLTIAKAFYIVAYFMHLKFEKVSLIYSIIVPLIFVLGAIAALLYEGDHWLHIR